jgi:hypothetical protein
MMAPSTRPIIEKVKIQIETKKLVPVILFLYMNGDDEKGIKSALELAKCILEAYDDMTQMKKDILETFVSNKSMIAAMEVEMKRRYPLEMDILKHIFGAFLFEK